MSENSNGNGPFVRLAEESTSYESEMLVNSGLQNTMRFRSHFGLRLSLQRGEYPSLHRFAQGLRIMPQGGE
jgi:hypothetical protein